MQIARAAYALTAQRRRGVDDRGRPVAPGPIGDPLLGHYRHVQKDRIGYLTKLFVEHGDLVHLHVLGMPIFIAAHPDYVEHVLNRAYRVYTKQTVGYKRLREFLGNGLLTSEGSFWLRQRRIAQPAFHRSRIEGFAGSMVRAAEDQVERWSREKRAIDVTEDLMRVTLRIAGETLLSNDPSDHAQTVGRAISVMLEEANQRINRPQIIPERIPTPRNRRYLAARAALDSIVLAIIDERRRGKTRGDDLLQMLLEARDEETGEGMNDQQLRDEVMTMFLAGHETTSNMLSWTLYLLSRSPEHERRVHEEALAVLGDRSARADDIGKLVYTKRVIQEAMRLYPPAWIMGRSPSEDDELGGYTIPKGSLVFVSPWITHRHPGFWTDPEGFDPDRWLPERVAEQHRYQYFPFAGGPRMCIGAGFAMMEGQLLLATFLRRLRFDLVPGHPVEVDPLVTLRPKHGIKVHVHPR
jgi:cytochrome P450